jgi:hypothetical protein
MCNRSHLIFGRELSKAKNVLGNIVLFAASVNRRSTCDTSVGRLKSFRNSFILSIDPGCLTLSMQSRWSSFVVVNDRRMAFEILTKASPERRSPTETEDPLNPVRLNRIGRVIRWSRVQRQASASRPSRSASWHIRSRSSVGKSIRTVTLWAESVETTLQRLWWLRLIGMLGIVQVKVPKVSDF